MRIGSSSSSFFGTTMVWSAFSWFWCATARMRPLRALISSRRRGSSPGGRRRGRSRRRQRGLDQRERAVLQLGGGVGLGVDVGDLLELQGGLEGDRVAAHAPDEHHRLGAGVLLASFSISGSMARISSIWPGSLRRPSMIRLPSADRQVADPAEVQGEQREGDDRCW